VFLAAGNYLIRLDSFSCRSGWHARDDAAV
jgi:hypothetical protein